MHILELMLFLYFSYVSLYAILLSGAALLVYRSKDAAEAVKKRKIAVLIPAYREDAVIVSSARHALQQTYPAARYDVVVIADSLQPQTLESLRALPIILVGVSFEKSTKVKALNAGMEFIGDAYDCVVVLDADNIMERDFLTKMNNLFEAGYPAIQARRIPKNENTSMAFLDGLSETINNFIYRQGTVALGMSSSLNGSGMFFDYKIYKTIMRDMNAVGGFDRELELKFLERGIKIHYARNIVVHDEKVENTKVFEQQRRRWISSQFFYLKKYFMMGCTRLLRGDITFFNSAVLRNAQLPRLLNLGLLSIIVPAVLVFNFPEPWHTAAPLWLGANLAAILFAVPRNAYTLMSLRSILLIPGIFVKMFMILFRMKGANKTFIHTPHGQTGSYTSEKAGVSSNRKKLL